MKESGTMTFQIHKWEFSYLAYHNGGEEITAVLTYRPDRTFHNEKKMQPGDLLEIFDAANDRCGDDFRIVDVWHDLGAQVCVIAASRTSVASSH